MSRTRGGTSSMLTPSRPVIAPVASSGLLDRRFRANPDLRLVAHADLPSDQEGAFADLARDPRHYGLLVPQQVVEVGVKAIDRDVADLFRHLVTPGPLPARLLATDDRDGLERRLAALVLDGILEVEIDGAFATGPTASERLWVSPREASAGGVVARLSRDALRLALQVPDDDPAVLSAWIYGYNAVPLGPAWSRRLADEDGVEHTLGLHGTGAVRSLLAPDYIEVWRPAWKAWHLRDSRSADGSLHLPYKLYVSPHPSALIEAFAPLIRVLVDERVPAFKRGRGPIGLLRADKLVIYLESWERLRDVASTVAGVLCDVAPQGVPFTAAASADGLLSWGMDPPPSARVPGWNDAQSWRSWLTNRLARGLVYARRVGARGDRAIDFALARLRLAGVDTSLWVPAEGMFESDEVEP